MNKKDEFIALLRSTERDGIETVIEELENLGFSRLLPAPSST